MYLLKLEWLKMRDYTVFRVMSVLYLILLPGFFLAGWSALPDTAATGGPAPGLSKEIIYGFPDIFKYLGYAGNWMVFLFLGFIAVISISNEFSNRTLRQNIITGLSRTEYFLSKLYFILAVSFVATIWYAGCAMISGFLVTEKIYTSAVFKYIDYVPRYFLMCVGYMSFGALLGVLIRKTGIALFLYIAYGMFIEVFIRWVVHLNIVQHESMTWYPLNAFEDLVPLPFLEMINEFTENAGFNIVLTPPWAIALSLFYMGLFFFFSWRRLNTADL